MSETDDFLSRWSRRKREVARQEEQEKGERSEVESALAAPEDAHQRETDSELRRGEDVERKAPQGEEPTFDLSKLPSLDSITADTDIRPFLAAGVPTGLRQAALRRAWSADPMIRDFIGIAENQWDFTGAAELPGFDFSPLGDVTRKVAEFFGEKSAPDPGTARTPEEQQPPGERQEASDATQPTSGPVLEGDHTAVDKRDIEQAPRKIAGSDAQAFQEVSGNGAPQNNDATQYKEARVALRRSHGGAVPR